MDLFEQAQELFREALNADAPEANALFELAADLATRAGEFDFAADCLMLIEANNG